MSNNVLNNSHAPGELFQNYITVDITKDLPVYRNIVQCGHENIMSKCRASGLHAGTSQSTNGISCM